MLGKWHSSRQSWVLEQEARMASNTLKDLSSFGQHLSLCPLQLTCVAFPKASWPLGRCHVCFCTTL